MSLTLAKLLGTVLIGGKTIPIIRTIGMNFIIKTITTTTTSICNLIQYISERYATKDIIETLKSIDIDYSVNIIEQLVAEQEKDETPISVKMALVGVNEILDDIHVELNKIKETIDYHESKWFSKWRTFDCSNHVSLIKSYKIKLDRRYKKLIELLQIYHKK